MIEHAGLLPSALEIMNCEEDIRSSYGPVQDLLARDNRPALIPMWGHQLAVSAIRGIRQADLRTLEDDAIVGCHDIEISKSPDPPLTAVRQQSYQSDIRQLRLLLGGLESEQTSEGGTVIVKSELSVGATT